MKSKLIAAALLSSLLTSSVMAGANDGVVATATGNKGKLGVSTMYAVVDANGVLVRSSGVNDVEKVVGFSGSYRVNFRRNVRDCAYVASVGLSGASGSSSNGVIDVTGSAFDVKGVFIETNDMTGNLSDRGFHLIVFCSE